MTLTALSAHISVENVYLIQIVLNVKITKLWLWMLNNLARVFVMELLITMEVLAKHVVVIV